MVSKFMALYIFRERSDPGVVRLKNVSSTGKAFFVDGNSVTYIL